MVPSAILAEVTEPEAMEVLMTPPVPVPLTSPESVKTVPLVR